MNWKEELKQAYPNGLTCLKVCSDIGRDHIPGLEAFIESLLEQQQEELWNIIAEGEYRDRKERLIQLIDKRRGKIN